MNRDEALNAVKSRIKNGNLVKHMLAAEAIMRALANRFGEDEVEWGLAGLLHDIDLDVVNGDMSRHSKVSAEIAGELGASEAVTHAVLSHNERHGVACASRMDKALFCTDPLTGLITAAVLVLPGKKLAALEAKSVQRRFKEKGFAAGANREHIARCSEIGLTLDEFIEIGLKAMQGIAADLGL
ncbi:MAG: HD domain-containing protein [Dehalococcoidales bacterium]|nr:HD domain-containing protein [Dehalococcoidales bacterium]